MTASSTPSASLSCDISLGGAWHFAEVDSADGSAERAREAAWVAENYGLHAFGWALSRQAEWWEHVEAVRQGSTPLALVLQHRYARGRRAEVVAELLRRAAAAPSTTPAGRPTTALATFEMQNGGLGGWHDEAPLEPSQPQRALREDAARTICLGAIRVSRRGAHRCLSLDCVPDKGGAKLSRRNSSDYCHQHEANNDRVRGQAERDQRGRAGAIRRGDAIGSA